MSLIDAVISLLVMTVTLVPLSIMAINNVRFSANSALSMKAAYFAQGIMDQIVSDYEVNGYSDFYNHWPQTLSFPDGFGGSASFSDQSLNGVDYILATVVVSNDHIQDVQLEAWLIDDGT